MAISSFAAGSYGSLQTANQLTSMRAALDKLQTQLATGQASTTYAGLGSKVGTSLSTHAQLSTIDSYLDAISNSSTRLKLVTSGVSDISSIAAKATSDLNLPGYNPGADGRTPGQQASEDRLKQVIDTLNTQVDGKYLYSGRSTDTQPVASFDKIINGDGTADGVSQLVSERKAADNRDGTGRLAVSYTAGGTSIGIAKAADSGPFGFGISAATASGTGITASAGGGAIAINVASQPAEGDSVRLTFNLPDGTQTNITLKATAAAGLTSAGTFQIGTTPAATAANLNAALGSALQTEAGTSLGAASAVKAASDFFNSGSGANVPRVTLSNTPGTPDSYGASGTKTTVSWYQGDDASPASPPATAAQVSQAIRATAAVKVDSSQTVGIGVQANEQAFRNILTQLAVTTVDTFSTSNPNDAGRYQALSQRVSTNLTSTSVQSAADIGTDLALANTAMTNAKTRHTATQSVLQGVQSDVEGISDEDVATQFLTLQTRLQASYQTTSTIAKLNLVNYL